MGYLLVTLPCLLLAADGSEQRDLKGKIIAAWSERYQQIRTVEYVLEGTELITPDFLTGLATAPESCVGRPRPRQIMVGIDLPNRRIYFRQECYQWQVHLERFVKRVGQVVLDEPQNRVESYREWFDGESNNVTRNRSDSRSVAQSVGRSMDTLPLWFNSGILFDVGHSPSVLTFPEYNSDSRAQWTVLANDSRGEANRLTRVEVRCIERPTAYRLDLDAEVGYLPVRFAAMVNRSTVLEVNVSYVENDGCYVANKWEATAFSSKGKIERYVSLSLRSCSVNKTLPADSFGLHIAGN
jgi:hypothetical protein